LTKWRSSFKRRDGSSGSSEFEGAWYHPASLAAFLGGEDFRDWLLDGIEERLVGKSDSYSSSEQAHEHGEQRAQELLEASCRFFDWTSTDLEALKGGMCGDC